MVRIQLPLFVFALLGQEVLGQVAKTCYHCGYRCSDMHGISCTPEPIPEVPFCGDPATIESSTKECSGSDECCGVLREYFEMEVDGKNKVDMLTLHGCEKDMAGALGSNIEVICEGHANACYNVSRDNIHDDFLTEATACFCDGDLCNKDLPDLPFPPPPPTDPTDKYTTARTTTIHQTTTVSRTTTIPRKTTIPSNMCSDDVMFSTSSNSYPHGKLTCYDDNGSELERKEDEEEFTSGTTCVFLSTGHVSTGGFVIEMFCQEARWQIVLTEL